MSRRLGLIVGLNHYQDPQFRPLQFAEHDAKALAQWLVNGQGGKWSPADVQLVQGMHATKELVESLIGQLCLQNAGPGDLVFIYFAGHAFIDERSGEGYLALANTSYQQSASGLHLLSFAQQILARSRAAQIVLLLDCFQTGQAWSMQRTAPYDFKPLLGPTLLNALQQIPDRLFFCSCRGNEIAAEAGERGLGLFAHRMIVGLCGPAANPLTGTQTMQQLHSYLFGVLGEQQRPQIFGQGQQPFLLTNESVSQPVLSPIMESPQSASADFYAGTPPPQPGYPMDSTANQASYAPAATMTQTPPQGYHQSGITPPQAANEQQFQQQCQQLLQQAQQQAQTQMLAEAINSVNQALQLMPRYTAALTLKGQLLGTMGRMAEANATVEQLLHIEPQNALAWSMRAVILNNMGQFEAAKEAIERSLELDANNPESYGIKTNIMAGMAVAQSQLKRPSQNGSQRFEEPKKNAGGFFLSFLGQIGAFLLGAAGMGILILKPTLPPLLGLGIASLGLALLCVGATRGAFRYGLVYLIPTLLFSLIAGGLVGAAYKLGLSRLILTIQDHPNLLIPIVALVAWLALAAALPLILTFGGLVGRGIAKARAS